MKRVLGVPKMEEKTKNQNIYTVQKVKDIFFTFFYVFGILIFNKLYVLILQTIHRAHFLIESYKQSFFF